jgi:hypothetical protein
MVLHRRAPYNPQPSFEISSLKSQRKAEFGLFRFRSPLLTESLLLSLPPGTEMVHFPGLARTRLYIQRAVTGFCPVGFPHSEIPGSMGASPSPRLIAGSHVLLRRLAPRHPPYALSSLTIKSAQHTAWRRPLGYEPNERMPCLLCRLAFTISYSVRISAGQMSTCRRRTIQFSKIAEYQAAASMLHPTSCSSLSARLPPGFFRCWVSLFTPKSRTQHPLFKT